MTKVHDRVHSLVVDTAELQRALGSGETRARQGPRRVHLHDYSREVMVDIISPSSRRKVVGIDGNVDGMAVLHRRLR